MGIGARVFCTRLPVGAAAEDRALVAEEFAAAAVRGRGAPNRGAAGARWIVSEKLLEMRHFWARLYGEEPELASLGPPESFGMEN